MKRKYKKFKPIQPFSLIIIKSILLFIILDILIKISYCETHNYLIYLTVSCYFVFTFAIREIRKHRQREESLMYRGSNINNVDKLDGFEFERYLRAHFRNKGYKVELTPLQQDYGVDLVLIKGKDRIAVQAKRYNHEAGYKVNYRAVQEVAAGKAYYNCSKGIVVTNSFFTNSARELAKVNQIDLWDRKRLIQEFQAKNAPCISEYKKEFAFHA